MKTSGSLLQIISTRQVISFYSIDELNASSRMLIRQEFETLAEYLSSNCQLDMQQIKWIDSSGIALLIELKKISLRKGLELELINIAEPVRKKLQDNDLMHIIY